MSGFLQFLGGVITGLVIGRFLKPRGENHFIFRLSAKDGFTITGEIVEMELRKNQSVPVEAVPVGANGEPAQIQAGTAKWKSADETVATVTVDPTNELKATVTSLKQGSTSISIEADGDPSQSGEIVILGSADVRVLGPNAVGFDLDFGDVTENETGGETDDETKI